MPIDPTILTGGAEWSVTPPSRPGATEGAGSFGGVLGRQLESLSGLQADAASQSRALAAGTATDASQVVLAVERARLAMQLASTLRTKSVEAITDLMRTTV